MKRSLLSVAALACLTTLASAADAPRSPTPSIGQGPFEVTTVAGGLQNPWGLAFLPDGRMVVTEKPGRMRIIGKDGKLSEPLKGLPAILAQGQGGLLDVAVSPQFGKDSLVYFSFSEPGTGGAGTAVARGKLAGDSLEQVQVIWRQSPKVNSGFHWGSRIVFRPDGTLFITMGDRMSQRPLVQDLSTTIGKVVRVNADGSIPKDNPFADRKDAGAAIWSYGHRNAQAATLDPATNELWTVEHGAMGGDELNNPKAGRNYGWPVITYGVDYSGAKIGEGTAREGMEQPVYFWDPVIAPSGMTFYTGSAFPDWKGNLFIGSLKPGALVRLEMSQGKVTKETRYHAGAAARIRNVRQGPDGFLYLLTDAGDGKILRLSPKR